MWLLWKPCHSPHRDRPIAAPALWLVLLIGGPVSFNFHEITKAHQTPMHFAGFGEPLTIVTSAGVSIESTAIVRVTEQTEASDSGTGVIVRAEMVIPDRISLHADPDDYSGDEIGIRSTWKLVFRGQNFGIESWSPPVAGFIKLNAIALSRELTHAPVLNAR